MNTAALSDRAKIAHDMARRLSASLSASRDQWASSAPIHHVIVDDLLPDPLAHEIARELPRPTALMGRDTLRERKKVGVHLEDYAPRIGDALLAFQAPEVIAAVAEITGLGGLEPDPSLYASGLSVMQRGDFLNPHLDNSHDGDQRLYRAVNLLYYVTPDWSEDHGGNLELWPPGAERIRIGARFNRLVIMQTDQTSWHSVDPVAVDRPRWCISNYFFSQASPTGVPYRHVTTFRGRPGEVLKSAVLSLDGIARNALGRLFPWLLTRTAHRRRGGD